MFSSLTHHSKSYFSEVTTVNSLMRVLLDIFFYAYTNIYS